MRPLTPEGFQEMTGVSDDTLDRLKAYTVLLDKWQRKVNLVGRGSLGDVWRRHFLDSAQLWPLVPTHIKNVVDIGSGAGLPGVPLKIAFPGLRATLVEATGKKAAFLEHLVGRLGVPQTHRLQACLANLDSPSVLAVSHRRPTPTVSRISTPSVYNDPPEMHLETRHRWDPEPAS